MKCIFNTDGTMFMVGPDHITTPDGMHVESVPDDLDIRKPVKDDEGNEVVIEVTLDELRQRHADYLANYANARREAYPSIEDQLDMLYHGGFDAWKAAIDAVKRQYPKPAA